MEGIWQNVGSVLLKLQTYQKSSDCWTIFKMSVFVFLHRQSSVQLPTDIWVSCRRCRPVYGLGQCAGHELFQEVAGWRLSAVCMAAAAATVPTLAAKWSDCSTAVRMISFKSWSSWFSAAKYQNWHRRENKSEGNPPSAFRSVSETPILINDWERNADNSRCLSASERKKLRKQLIGCYSIPAEDNWSKWVRMECTIQTERGGDLWLIETGRSSSQYVHCDKSYP